MLQKGEISVTPKTKVKYSGNAPDADEINYSEIDRRVLPGIPVAIAENIQLLTNNARY